MECLKIKLNLYNFFHGTADDTEWNADWGSGDWWENYEKNTL